MSFFHNNSDGARRIGLEIVLLSAVGGLGIQLWLVASENRIDLSLRNSDYPDTHISLIHVDLASPNHWVHLIWTGPESGRQEVGPFRSSPGKGLGSNDCNDPHESNCAGSDCTPKGTRAVEGFADAFVQYPECKYLTWVDRSRSVAFHSHEKVPDYPDSQGCIRLDMHAAQLIHNNSRIWKTKVIIDGTWTKPPTFDAPSQSKK